MADGTNRRAGALAAWLLVALALVLATGGAIAQDGHEHYERAQARFAAGQLPEAVVEIKNALQADSRLLPAYTLLARIYLRVGVPSAAKAALDKARELGADDLIVLPLQAQAMLELHEYKQLLEILPTQGYPPEALTRLLVIRAHALVALRELDEAQTTYRLALAQSATEPEALVGLVRVALLQGKVYAAEARASRALQVAPDAPQVWTVKGNVAHVLGNQAAALRAYEQALALDEENSEARLARTGLLLGQQRLQEAASELSRLEQAVPLDPRVTYLRAAYRSKSGDQASAREELARAKDQLEEMGEEAVVASGELLMLAGIASFEAGQLERASHYLERYVVRHPKRSDARQLLARVRIKQGDVRQAIQGMEEVLDEAGHDPGFLSLLAHAYTLQGRHQEAARRLEVALEANPDSSLLRRRLAMSWRRAGREEDAMAMLSELFREEPEERQGDGAILAALYVARGDGEKALAVTRQLMAFQPRNLGHLNLLGRALALTGDTSGARMAFEEAVAIDPGFVPAILGLGRMLAREGDPSRAGVVLERALQSNQDNVAIMVELGRAAVAAGEPEEALRWLLKARETDPRSQSAALALVDLHLAQGRTGDAMTVARDALERNPRSPRAMAAVARVQLALGQRAEATAAYREMSRMAGRDASAQFQIARSQAAAGALDDAIASLEKGLQDAPGHLPTRVLLVELLGRSGKLQRGLEMARGLREAQPEMANAHRLEGALLARMRRFEPALQALEVAQQLEPSTTHVLSLARVRSAAGEPERAREGLSKWLQDHPRDRVVEVALADSYLGAGDYARARDHYQNVLRQDDDSTLRLTAMVRNNLAYVLDQQGDPQALAHARTAQAAAPGNAAIADTLGWILVRQGQAEEGLRYLRDAHARAAANPGIRYHMAEALAALGRESEALVEVKAALASSGSFAEKEQARALMKRLGP